MRIGMHYLGNFPQHAERDWSHLYSPTDVSWSAFLFKKKKTKDYGGALNLSESQMYDAEQNLNENEYRSADEFAEQTGRKIMEQDPSKDPKLSHIMLGVRRELSHTVKNLLSEGLKDYNIDSLSRNAELRQQNPKLKAGKGFLKKLGTLFAPSLFKSRFRSPAEKLHDDLFGIETDPEQQRLHAARNIWRSLDTAQQNAVRTEMNRINVQPLPRPAVGVPIDVSRLAHATAQHLFEIRRSAKVGADFVFNQPTRMHGRESQMADVPSHLDHLILHRRNENKRIKELLSTSVYDSEELRLYLKEMRESTEVPKLVDPFGNPIPGPLENRIFGNDVFDLLKEVLENNGLTPIKNNPPVQALIHKLRELQQEGGLHRVRNLLRSVRDSLPNVELEKDLEDQEQNDEGEKAEKQTSLGKNLLESKQKLMDLYDDAQSNSSKYTLVDKDITAARALISAGGGGRGNVDTGLTELQKQKQALLEKKSEIKKQVRKLETEHRSNIREIKKLLGNTKIDGITDTPDDIDLTSEDQLFGNSTAATPVVADSSDFQQHIQRLPEDKLTEVGSAQRQRLNSHQLLFRLHLEFQKEKYGDHMTTDMLDRAQTCAMNDITQVLNVPIDRATNRELSEKLSATNWQAFKKIWRARYSKKTVYTSQKILAGLTQKGSGLERFADIGPSMTDEQIQVWLNDNPEMDTQDLNLYVQKLTEVLLSFRYDGGKVELFDEDAVELRRYIARLQNIVKVRRMFAAGFEEKITPDADVVAEATDFTAELDRLEEEEQKTIIQSLKDRVKSIGRWISGKLFGKEKKDFTQQIIDEKMDQKQANELLQALGLASVPGAISAAATAVNIAQNGTWQQRAWKKTKTAPAKVSAVGRRAGGRAMEIGRFLGKTGYYITAPLWWPAMKVGQGGLWLGRKTWGGAKAVGRGIKRFWNWV